MRHVGGVEGGNVQDHWQMTDPHSGADRGQARSAQPAKRRSQADGVAGKSSCLGRRMARGQFDGNKKLSTQTTAAKATSWAFLRRHLVVGRGSHPEAPPTAVIGALARWAHATALRPPSLPPGGHRRPQTTHPPH